MASGNRFLVVDYAHSWTGATMTVVVTTDVPCHLWLRYTNSPERMHLQVKTKRGLRFMANPYYCFVAYQEIEQNEAGDTTEHTFTWGPWATNVCFWYYLRGTIATVASPSTSPVWYQCFNQGPVFTLGILGQDPPLSGTVYLEAAGDTGLTNNVPVNAVTIAIA